MKSKKLSISDELQIVRFGNGIKLIEPDDSQDKTAIFTLGNFNQLPFSFYLLNRDSTTHKINEEGAAICGFQSIKNSIGKSLEEVSQKESAIQLMNNCSDVINNNTIKIYEEENLRKDHTIFQFLSIKSPWYNDQNKIIGILGCSIVLGKHSLANSLSEIRKLGLLNAPNPSIDQHSFFDVNKLKANNLHLSQREKQCLYLTLKGYTAKRIARSFEISHRTVEEYLINIRIKTGLTSKAELIEFALDNLISFGM